MKKILVIGSVNMDLVTYVERIPSAGETINGLSFNKIPGGKGANQAVSASLAGCDVSMLAKVGNDSDGEKMEQVLKSYGVKTNFLVDENEPTGVATIIIEKNTGENRIIVVKGANGTLSIDDVKKNINLIAEADIILMQLEIPLSTVAYAASIAHSLNKIVILNPAPAKMLSKELLSNVDYLIPNETELEILTGEISNSEVNIISAYKKLHHIGVKKLIVTLGKKGSLFIDDNKIYPIKPYEVNAIDTTAAGDCFNGVFASCLANGYNDLESLTYASYASSICVTRKGAIPSLPRKDEIFKIETI